MSRTYFIQHRGQKILFMDFSGVTNTDQGLGFIEEAKSVVAKQPENSLLTLVDIADSSFDKRVTEAMKGLSAHNKPYVIANAMIGVSGLKKMLVQTISRVTGRKLTIFEDEQQAKDWLVEQAKQAQG